MTGHLLSVFLLPIQNDFWSVSESFYFWRLLWGWNQRQMWCKTRWFCPFTRYTLWLHQTFIAMEKLCWFIKGLCGPQNNIIFFQILWKSRCHTLDFHLKRKILDFLHLFHSWKNTTYKHSSHHTIKWKLKKKTEIFYLGTFPKSHILYGIMDFTCSADFIFL